MIPVRNNRIIERTFMKTIKFFLLSIIFGIEVLAQIPGAISYQGVLTDVSGNVKPDGNCSIIFSFYELETGGEQFGMKLLIG